MVNAIWSFQTLIKNIWKNIYNSLWLDYNVTINLNYASDLKHKLIYLKYSYLILMCQNKLWIFICYLTDNYISKLFVWKMCAGRFEMFLNRNLSHARRKDLCVLIDIISLPTNVPTSPQ